MRNPNIYFFDIALNSQLTFTSQSFACFALKNCLYILPDHAYNITGVYVIREFYFFREKLAFQGSECRNSQNIFIEVFEGLLHDDKNSFIQVFKRLLHDNSVIKLDQKYFPGWYLRDGFHESSNITGAMQNPNGMTLSILF